MPPPLAAPRELSKRPRFVARPCIDVMTTAHCSGNASSRIGRRLELVLSPGPSYATRSWQTGGGCPACPGPKRSTRGLVEKPFLGESPVVGCRVALLRPECRGMPLNFALRGENTHRRFFFVHHRMSPRQERHTDSWYRRRRLLIHAHHTSAPARTQAWQRDIHVTAVRAGDRVERVGALRAFSRTNFRTKHGARQQRRPGLPTPPAHSQDSGACLCFLNTSTTCLV